MKAILSAQDLAWRLGIPLSNVRELANEVDSHYREWEDVNIEKGKTRVLKVPDELLKGVQRRILKNVLTKFPLSESAQGGIKGRSPKTNAERHLARSLVVNLDIRDFFPSVRHDEVAKMFHRDFGCGRETTWLLTRLTTVDGQLPQGAPTSTMIANLLLAVPVDEPLGTSASDLDVEVTRFVDDFTFSGKKADQLINQASRNTSTIGLRTWRKRKKLKISPNSRRQEVTGLTVNSKQGPSVPRENRERVRAAIHQLRSIKRGKVERALLSIKGRINHVRQFNKGSAARLDRQLTRVLGEIEYE